MVGRRGDDDPAPTKDTGTFVTVPLTVTADDYFRLGTGNGEGTEDIPVPEGPKVKRHRSHPSNDLSGFQEHVRSLVSSSASSVGPSGVSVALNGMFDLLLPATK